MWCGCVHVVRSAVWSPSCGHICCYNVITTWPLHFPTYTDETHAHMQYVHMCTHLFSYYTLRNTFSFCFSLVCLSFVLPYLFKNTDACGFVVVTDISIPFLINTPHSLGQEKACFMNEFKPPVSLVCDILSVIPDQMGLPKIHRHIC